MVNRRKWQCRIGGLLLLLALVPLAWAAEQPEPEVEDVTESNEVDAGKTGTGAPAPCHGGVARFLSVLEQPASDPYSQRLQALKREECQPELRDGTDALAAALAKLVTRNERSPESRRQARAVVDQVYDLYDFDPAAHALMRTALSEELRWRLWVAEALEPEPEAGGWRFWGLLVGLVAVLALALAVLGVVLWRRRRSKPKARAGGLGPRGGGTSGENERGEANRGDGDSRVDSRLAAVEQGTRQLRSSVEETHVDTTGDHKSIHQLGQQFASVEARWEDVHRRVTNIEGQLSTNNAAVVDIRERLDTLDREAAPVSVSRLPGQGAEAEEGDATSTLDRERVVLRTAWRDFQKSVRQLYGVEIRNWRERLQQDPTYHHYLKVVETLPGATAGEGEGRLVLAAANRRLRLLSRLYEIPESLKPPDGHLENAEELMAEYRSLAQFLTVLESTDLGSDLLLFNPRHWLRGDFLKVADEVLKSAPNTESARLVQEALRSAGLQAMEIVPGRTRFDNRRHDAKSQVSDSRSPNGVIADVVRWGFQTLDAEPKVLQRAIVVVNRV